MNHIQEQQTYKKLEERIVIIERNIELIVKTLQNQETFNDKTIANISYITSFNKTQLWINNFFKNKQKRFWIF